MSNDLQAQQITLSSSDYDLRITNLARFIFKKLPVKSGTFMDIGAGNGLFLKFFKNKGFEVEGIELEKEQVHEMQKDSKLKDVKIQQGDITQLHGNADFDVVIASDVIEHIEDDVTALRNLFTFVKMNGHLIITVPAHMYLYGKRDEKWGHYRRYGNRDLINKISLLTDSKIISVSQWNILGYIAYFFFERILRRPIREGFRYKRSPFSKFVVFLSDSILKLEELVGGSPVGLTLVAVVKKKQV